MRSQNSNAWETTKYHLKLAKTNTSLRNIEQLTLVGEEKEEMVESLTDSSNGLVRSSETQFMPVR